MTTLSKFIQEAEEEFETLSVTPEFHNLKCVLLDQAKQFLSSKLRELASLAREESKLPKRPLNPARYDTEVLNKYRGYNWASNDSEELWTKFLE